MPPRRPRAGGAGWQPANQSHNAHHFAASEIVTVYYRWHPLYGMSLRVHRRQRCPYGEVVFVKLENGSPCALPAWMLRATCAGFVLGPPLIASSALRELRDLLSALLSAPECDKASLKLPSQEGRNDVSAEVSTRTTQPSPAGNRPTGTPARQGSTTDSGADRTAARRRPRNTLGSLGGRRIP